MSTGGLTLGLMSNEAAAPVAGSAPAAAPAPASVPSGGEAAVAAPDSAASPPVGQAAAATPPASPGGEAAPGGSEPAKAPDAVDLKIPEGLLADDPIVSALKAGAKELGPQAQKLVDAYAQSQAAQEQKVKAALAEQVKDWGEQLKGDKEFGGAKFDANLNVARRAVERFGSPELKEFFDSTGLGNHPAIVKAFHAVGKALAEDSIAGSSAAVQAAPSEKEIYAQLYPNTQF